MASNVTARLLREGKFQEILSMGGRDPKVTLSPADRVVLSTAHAFLGELEEADALAQLGRFHGLPADVRSQAETTHALVAWRRGHVSAALRHAQTALRLAQEAGDKELVAWAHVHIFRLLIEGGSIENALAALGEVRRSVAEAGIGQVTAYLHICVAVLEGQTGKLSEAKRHSRIADSLLDLAPNQWLVGQSLLVRGTASLLECDFAAAATILREAKENANRYGYKQTAIGVQSNLGHVELLTGRFEEARTIFKELLSDPNVQSNTAVAAAGGLARVELALNRFEECQEALTSIRGRTLNGSEGKFLYHVRWATLTAAQLAAKRGQFAEAMTLLIDAERSYRPIGDIPLQSAINLTAAFVAVNQGQVEDACRRLLAAREFDVSNRELHGLLYESQANAVQPSDPGFADHLRNRARSVWKHQGLASVTMEVPAQASAAHQYKETAGLTRHDIYGLTSSLASLPDLAYKPRLLGQEVLFAINSIAPESQPELVETEEMSPPPTVSADRVDLVLGCESGTRVSLLCRTPQDPSNAVIVSDVLRLACAALELDRARKDERRRAALWPAPPLEEQAGAFFIADEMKNLLGTARRVGPTTVPVLITGETGTGKEVLARTVHVYSSRAAAIFLPFNCSGVPKDMLDSQLFGHKKGSFTGAVENFPGVIRAAAGGTLFLDEIGETTLDVQPKLLRFLESGEVHPIGETQPLKTDVRIIAATNADLDKLVAEGRFREDLFYRLNIVRLHIPPLRERRVEIPTLANHYLQKHAQEYRKGNLRLAEETMEYLVLYRWPGNVRQLANEMRRLAALAEADAVLMPEHLSGDIAASRKTVPPSERMLEPTEIVVRIDQPLTAAVQHLERAMIQHAMKLTGNRMEETAARLGMSRKGLYLKRVRYGLEPPEGGPAVEIA